MSKGSLVVRWKLLMLAMLCACNFPYAAVQALDGPVATNAWSTTIVASMIPSAVAATDTRVMTVPTLVPTTAPSITQQPTPSLPATSIPDPAGCLRPPDDYTRVIINGEQLNVRTLRMLQHAQALYGGTIDFAGWAVTQGSYNPGGVKASFGTHDGGGAVDKTWDAGSKGDLVHGDADLRMWLQAFDNMVGGGVSAQQI